MTETEEPNEEEKNEGPLGSSHEKVRKEAEELMRGMLSDEAKQHMIKAGSELLLGLEAMIPESRISEKTRTHYTKMRKEFLLMAKSIIDSRLEIIEGEKASEGLKKIEVE